MEPKILPTEPWWAGYVAVRRLDDGFFLALAPLTYDRLRLVFCTEDEILDQW